MEAVARKQSSQEAADQIDLVKVIATKPIAICDSSGDAPTVISKGDSFLIDLIPMEGLNGLVGYYKGESFFVEAHEWTALAN